MQLRPNYPLERLVEWDGALAVYCNRASAYGPVCRLFRVVSRLGDGIFWYGLMLALVMIHGRAALLPVLHMVAAGLSCTLIYKWLKNRTLRPRPYAVRPQISLQGAPLDQFSFPSGHTLHAVAFSTVALAYYPQLAVVVLPFTVLVAASRVVLGLHYPSDVLAGALIGALVAALSVAI